jgi:hypothetical protein
MRELLHFIVCWAYQRLPASLYQRGDFLDMEV